MNSGDRATLLKLSESGVLHFSDGYRTKQAELGQPGFPILRVAQVQSGRLLLTEAVESVRSEFHGRIGLKLSRPGDVVLTTKGTVGRRARVPETGRDYVYSPQVCFFRVLDADQLDPEYLYYWLGSPRFISQINGLRAQTDMAEYVNLQDLGRILVDLPAVEVQRSVAAILRTLDDKIELNRRMNETLEATARAIFKSWFIDSPDAKQWQSKELRSVADIQRGRAYSSSDLAASSTALVTLGSFQRGGGYREGGLKPYTGTFKAEQVVGPGEVVIACTDVTQAGEVVGRPAVVDAEPRFERLVASQDVAVVRPNDTRVSPGFLYLLMRTEDFTEQALAYTSGTTVLHLDLDGVRRFEFRMPPREKLEAFSVLSDALFRKAALYRAESRTLRDLRDVLLPKLISGEIRV